MTALSNTAAVIVTFNRSAKLMRVLDALEAQTVTPDSILVVDNASTDDTRALVEARARRNAAIRYLGLPRNVGGAGGFHEGMKAAYAQGANYLWVSDDDAYANLLLPKLIAEARLDTQDAGLATELAYGTLRRRGTYDAVIA